MALHQTLDAFLDKELELAEFHSTLLDEQQKKEQLKKEVERLESIVQELEHGRVDVEPLLEQPTPPSKESR